MILKSRLPDDLAQPGELWLDSDEGTPLWGPVLCLGKSDNAGAKVHGNWKPGRERDPEWPYGDHPLGEYLITGWSTTGTDMEDIEKFGPAGKLVLDPISGQALQAKRNGRYGLLLHGGLPRPGPDGVLWTSDDVLRPTFGCLRTFNNDMAELVRLWKKAKLVRPLTRYVAERKAPER